MGSGVINTIVRRLHRISGKGEDLVKDWMGSTYLNKEGMLIGLD